MGGNSDNNETCCSVYLFGDGIETEVPDYSGLLSEFENSLTNCFWEFCEIYVVGRGQKMTQKTTLRFRDPKTDKEKLQIIDMKQKRDDALFTFDDFNKKKK